MTPAEIGLVKKIDIDHEMQQAYLDYAMSVIVARALPDARDGLKPVHRRILYAMHDMGLQPNTAFKKSARIVGEVLGKYHPHGEAAVYDALSRMAQDFSMRYILVDGQGNFGSVDGDSPAAMRYTEARLAQLSGYILQDIAKDTVDFTDNFDGTLQEPDVLPAAYPNLLVNGATGIAVGMATSVPPHNLAEVVDALRYMLAHWKKQDDISVEDLMQFIQGPDFPTGGIILQDAEGDGLANAYGTGRGRVTIRARAHLEEMDRGRSRIIVTELPYMTNKSTLIERIASLAREEKLEGISDLRDESDRQGMRIVIELTKNADPERVLQELYKSTPMQNTFSIIMLALVNGEPRMLSLKQALRVYLEHRQEIVRRRSEYDLAKAQKRAHILAGLRIAIQHLDEVIALIRRSPDVDTARARLIKRFKLDQEQAQAILEMPLRRLAALERKKLEDEFKELTALIKGLKELLKSPDRMRQVIADELDAIRQEFGDRRKTQIIQLQAGQAKSSLLTTSDLTPSETAWISITEDGLVSRSLDDKPPRLSGTVAPYWLLRANTRDTLYLVSETGMAASVAVHALPKAEKPSEGNPYMKVSALSGDEILAAAFTLPSKDDLPDTAYVLSVTRQGMVKKSSVLELPGPSAKGFVVTKVNPGDRLGWIRLTDGGQEILMATHNGMAIRYSEEDIRPMGLVAAGVMGMKLSAGDEVIGVEQMGVDGDVFLLASNGKGKNVRQEQFPRQGRYGQGVLAWKLPTRTRLVGMVIGKGTQKITVHCLKSAAKSVRLDAAPTQSRVSQGQPILDVKAGDELLGITVLWEAPQFAVEAKKPTRRRKVPGAQQEALPGLETNKQTTKKPAARTRKPAAAPAKTKPGRKSTPAAKTDQPAPARRGRKPRKPA
jgi:DNA gyrase subunit A